MNERSLRDNLAEKDAELREQLESMRDEYEKAARDRDTNSQAVEGLQKALQEVQTRKSRVSLTDDYGLTPCSAQSRAQKVSRKLRIANQRATKTSPSGRLVRESCKGNTRVDPKGA